MPDKAQSPLGKDIAANDVLKLFIVLNPVLLGAYLLFYDTFFARWAVFKILPAYLILISWTAAVTGAVPAIWIGLTITDERREKHIRNCLRVTVWALFFAFLTFVVMRSLEGVPAF